MFYKSHLMNERSVIIPIKQNNTNTNIDYSISNNGDDDQYSLKQNFFDPTKNSPPNEFLLKLRKRISRFETFTQK